MDDQNESQKPSNGNSKHSGFFAVDRRTWAKVCESGMNPAVSYLVLARGSGRDNRTSAWSVQAIETYTGISRGRAKTALKTLQENRRVTQLRGGSKPKYDLVPWTEIVGNKSSVRKPMTDRQQAVFDKVAKGEQLGSSDKQVAYNLTHKEWLIKNNTGAFSLAPEPTPDPPDWIWLPNEIVTGAADETPPLELVRQTQDVMTLRMLVDFYHAQNLREEGGISRTFLRQEYNRHEAGRFAQFTVWAFYKPETYVTWDDSGPTVCHRRDKLTKQEQAEGKNRAVDFFRRLAQLVDLGLIEWIPHLLESNDSDAEIIHPVGMKQTNSLDDELGLAAHEAGRTMLTERQCEWADGHDLWLVPVPRHIANVQVIGIARLRYRPHTRMTTAWWAELERKASDHLQHYKKLIAHARERNRQSA